MGLASEDSIDDFSDRQPLFAHGNGDLDQVDCSYMVLTSDDYISNLTIWYEPLGGVTGLNFKAHSGKELAKGDTEGNSLIRSKQFNFEDEDAGIDEFGLQVQRPKYSFIGLHGTSTLDLIDTLGVIVVDSACQAEALGTAEDQTEA